MIFGYSVFRRATMKVQHAEKRHTSRLNYWAAKIIVPQTHEKSQCRSWMWEWCNGLGLSDLVAHPQTALFLARCAKLISDRNMWSWKQHYCSGLTTSIVAKRLCRDPSSNTSRPQGTTPASALACNATASPIDTMIDTFNKY